MKTLFKIITIVSILFICSCSLIKPVSQYQNIPTEQSILKQIAEKHGLTVEQVSVSIALVNYAAIRSGVYSKDSAIEVLTQLRDIVSSQASYRYIRSWLIGTLTDYPELIEISELFPSSPLIIYEADQRILLDFIDRHLGNLGRM